jgi:hypothetical protein
VQEDDRLCTATHVRNLNKEKLPTTELDVEGTLSVPSA